MLQGGRGRRGSPGAQAMHMQVPEPHDPGSSLGGEGSYPITRWLF